MSDGTDKAALAVAHVFRVHDIEWQDHLIELLRDADIEVFRTLGRAASSCNATLLANGICESLDGEARTTGAGASAEPPVAARFLDPGRRPYLSQEGKESGE